MSASELIRAACVALVLCAGAASADPRWGLTWKAPEGCIQAAELAERVERRLGNPVFGTEPDLRIDGYLAAATGTPPGAKWRARLTLVDAQGSVQGSRDVTSPESSCRAIDDSLVLVVAVMIDPKAALTPFAAPGEPPKEPEPAPPPAQVAPAPPPQLPRPAPQPYFQGGTPPARMELVNGNIYLGYQALDHATFYSLVHRNDLQFSLAARLANRILGLTFGFIAVTAGAGFLAAHARDVDCVRWSGTPTNRGSCVESSNWALFAGAGIAAFGVASLVVGFAVPSYPTSEAEDRRLIDQYNSNLREPRPATVRLQLSPVPGGLVAGLSGALPGL